MTTAREFMTVGTDCARPHHTAQEAARVMTQLGVAALPICGEGRRVCGVITDRDIAIKIVGIGKDPATTRLQEFTQDGSDVITIGADDDVTVAMKTMLAHQVRRLPVIEGYELVGMISQADLARGLPDPQIGDLLQALSTD